MTAAATAPASTPGANYETGFFSTPSDLLQAAIAVSGAITDVDSAIDGNEDIPQDWWDGFTAFESQWKAFYSSNFGSGSSTPVLAWLTSDLEAQLVSFQQQTATWQTQAQGYGVVLPGPVIQPADNNVSLPTLPTSWITGLVVVAVIIIALVVFK